MATSTIAHDATTAADDLAGALTQAADRLAADAYLFESPADYLSGVEDLVALLRVQLTATPVGAETGAAAIAKVRLRVA